MTAGIVDRREQANALYQWVSKNIRYVAIFLEAGSVIPHAASTILDAKYGDCKDHVTLFEALLAAKGIDSSPVLVSSGSAFWQPAVAVIPGVFNHAITYIPEFKLLADSTARTAPFGILPPQLLGRPALITDKGDGRAELIHLPVSNPNRNETNVETAFVAGAEGTVHGTSRINNTGVYDVIARSMFANAPTGTIDQIASSVMRLTNQNGEGKYEIGQPYDLSRVFTINTRVELPNYIELPGPRSMILPIGLLGPNSIYGAFAATDLPVRDFPISVLGGRFTETVTLTLPGNVKVLGMPRSSMIENKLGKYASTYNITNQTITATRVLELSPPNIVISPNEYRLLRDFGISVRRDLLAQVLYE